MSLLRSFIVGAARIPVFSSSRRNLHLKHFDHVCLCVSDVPASIGWYSGMFASVQHLYRDTPNFYPRCLESPAFLRVNDKVNIALLPVDAGDRIVDHRGAHVAFRVSDVDFSEARGTLGARLEQNRINDSQDVGVDFQDYGIQQSLFFHDPDGNVLELTRWKHGN